MDQSSIFYWNFSLKPFHMEVSYLLVCWIMRVSHACHMIITFTSCVYHMKTMQFSIMTLCYYYFRFVILRYLLVYWIISLHLTLIPSQNMPLKTSGATSYQGKTPFPCKIHHVGITCFSVIITYCVSLVLLMIAYLSHAHHVITLNPSLNMQLKTNDTTLSSYQDDPLQRKYCWC